ncbi:hypothetical protein AAIR98_001931 [Elusimicrobium simillimum]|uniref:DNA glycosylase AlkZ-like family protein n=1 Tax=Elusimicrobium simillimum TaxID=3143438 RepID=UPI003C6ECCA4
MQITREQIFFLRLKKSGLAVPHESAADCAVRLFGVQSQFQQFSEISIFNRVQNITEDSLAALFDSRDIIKLWGQRNTVHLFHKNDWKYVSAAYGNRNNFVTNFFKDNMESLKKGVGAIDRHGALKPLTKRDISEILNDAIPHVTHEYRDYAFILKATLEGILFAVPARPHIKEYDHVSKVFKAKEIKEFKQLKQADAIKYIMQNYFTHYAPASFKDFLHWSGLTKKEAEPVFNKLKKDLAVFEYNKTPYYMFKDDEDIKILKNKTNKSVVRLLGKFDPLMVSFSDKTWAMPKDKFKHVWRPAAHVEAVVIAGQKVAGTWRYAIKGKEINFEIFLFNTLAEDDKKLIKIEAEKIAKFLNKKIKSVTYKKVK